MKEENKAGFAFWLEKGNPFSDRRSHGLIVSDNDFRHATNLAEESNESRMEYEQSKVGAGTHGTLTNGAMEQHPSSLNDEPNEDEDEDLLADFIDEDSQLPSRVSRGSKSGKSKDHRFHDIADENLILTGSAVGILR